MERRRGLYNSKSAQNGHLVCHRGQRTRSSQAPANMIIRLGRLTPGYFRLLQRQVAGEVQSQPQDRSLNQIAMMLAIMGLSLSYYSAKQMTEKVQRSPVP
ncbi:putative transmembrane protein ZNF593OS isoform X2 [Hemibagrus wyckioides]|uniref:putative transmembrane protein ZNF593OS isoform X2 n=1 Tax=Hemibagrus wyckioides TaxID=337641 RepID=UPI00266CE33A|nr:putative transmembrane protein ZNF593OS isoform X2 [Hemibagrus wyckioides]